MTSGEQSAEMAALKKDAARYRWLRHNAGFSIAENLFGPHSMTGFVDDDLDVMIDGEITNDAKTRLLGVANAPAPRLAASQHAGTDAPHEQNARCAACDCVAAHAGDEVTSND